MFNRNYIEMLNRLDKALERLVQANLKLKPSKCAFEKRAVNFLGYVVNEKRISTDPETLRRIQEWPHPPTKIKLAAFFAM